MIFQGNSIDNSAAIAEALTAAEIARQEALKEAKQAQMQLESTQTELADADAALAILGVTVDE